MSSMNVGIIGCGNISAAYLTLAKQFVGYKIVACADIDKAMADERAAEFDCQSMSVEQILADESVELIVNLTVPDAHFDVSHAIISAGKHVYSEKPYVLSLEQGMQLRELAVQKNVRIGSAPDTFLGGAHQRARDIVDSGEVGKIVGGSCYFQSHGMEDWHPQPDFFYQPGGGPILDMGPYYISNLIQLLGPVNQVVAMASKPFAQRTISSEPRSGEVIDVAVQTTVNAILEFKQGAQITFAASWDVWSSENNLIELHGTEKSMIVPNPNHFGGDVRVRQNDDEEESFAPFSTLSVPNLEDAHGKMASNYRGIGLSDMVVAIREDREHRCNADLALHVIDTLMCIEKSAQTGRFEKVSTTCNRPEAMPDGVAKSLVNAV